MSCVCCAGACGADVAGVSSVSGVCGAVFVFLEGGPSSPLGLRLSDPPAAVAAVSAVRYLP